MITSNYQFWDESLEQLFHKYQKEYQMQNHNLGTAMTAARSEAVAQNLDVRGQVRATIAALIQAIKSQASTWVDTPEERQSIEREAVTIFNGMFAASLGPAATLIIDGLITSLLDGVLSRIGTVSPPVNPTPVVPTPAVVTPVTSIKPE